MLSAVGLRLFFYFAAGAFQEFHSRKIMVLAEGVEEKEEFEYLVRLGIDLFQGYYLARPA